ncbi:MAG: efflux RND transporter permease subunit [Roseburia sp.]|nr:efflux RND transporter permease subunit [Roseburia sp.]
MSRFSVKKPLTVFMAAIIIIILGVVAYTKMTPDLLPNIDMPYVIVMTSYPGATPEKVETVISKPMEQTLATLENIKEIQSISSSNTSTLILEFTEDVNMDTISVDILQKVNLIQGYWDDSVGTPIILKMNPSMLPVSVAAVSMEGMDQAQLSSFVNDTLMNKLEGTAGVASISSTGLLQEDIHVVITQEKIDEANEHIREGIDKQIDAQMEEAMQAAEEAAREAAGNAQASMSGAGIQAAMPDMTGDVMSDEAMMAQSMPGEVSISGQEELIRQQEEMARQQEALIQQQEEAMAQAQAQAEEQAKEQAEEAKEQAYESTDLHQFITMDMISGILAAQNFAMPSGYVEQDGVSYLVSVGDEITSLEEIQELILLDLKIEDVEPVRLGDVAEVFMADNAGDLYAKINGDDGIILSFSKQSDYATAKVSSNIIEKFEQLETQYEGLSFVSLMDQGDYIYMIIESILQNLLLGALFAIIILFLFLKDVKPTFITLCSIPISVIFAVVLMYFTGISLNIISMSGLAISVGMLVDNSVVVIENIYRLKSKGVSTIQAAVSGASQVAGAITASTLTTVCVFAPIVFVEGITRQLFTDLALTIAYTLIASLLIALTLVPAMSAGILKNVKEKEHKLFDKFLSGYRKVLTFALKYKPVVLLLAVALLAVSVYGTVRRGFSFMPEMSMPQLSITLEMPEDADFEEMTEVSDTVIERISTLEEVETIGAMAGEGSIMSMMSGSAGGTSVTMYVMLSEDAERSTKEVEEEITKLCADLECEMTVSSSAMSGASSILGGEGVSIQVYGDDLDALSQAAKDVAEILEDVEGTAEVSNGIEETDPEIHFMVDKEAAMKEGLTVAQVFAEISNAMTEKKDAASITMESNEYDIAVYDDAVSEMTPEEIKKLTITVTDAEGNEKELAIGDIAQIEEKESLTSIQRRNQNRYLTVSAAIAEGYNVTLVTDAAEKALQDFERSGIRLEFSGENETIMEAMEQLVLMLLLGVVLVYMIMVAQFQSLKSPFIIMFTIPLAFTGGLLALLLSGMEISIIAMLGFVMLSGIIVNNGIVLVDYINQLRIEGKAKKEAIIEAGMTRMRPILMTSITTILGLSVMVLGIGGMESGAEMMRPLALVCIGGLIYATILTLFVVPVLYDLMNGEKMRVVAKEDLEIVQE